MVENVIVEYSDFSKENPIVEKITFDIITNVSLILTQSEVTDESGETIKTLNLTMENDDTEIVSGDLDTDIINALIRSLAIFKSQISE